MFIKKKMVDFKNIFLIIILIGNDNTVVIFILFTSYIHPNRII